MQDDIPYKAPNFCAGSYCVLYIAYDTRFIASIVLSCCRRTFVYRLTRYKLGRTRLSRTGSFPNNTPCYMGRRNGVPGTQYGCYDNNLLTHTPGTL